MQDDLGLSRLITFIFVVAGLALVLGVAFEVGRYRRRRRRAGGAVPSRLVHPKSGQVLAESLEIPRTSLGRALGLMFRAELAAGQGMLLDPCNGIHMFFMRFPIDAVFLDGQDRVRKVYPNLGRWRIVPLVWGAASVIELPAGTVADMGLEPGDPLEFLAGVSTAADAS